MYTPVKSNNGPDQHAHPCRLSRAFSVRRHIHCTSISVESVSIQRRLRYVWKVNMSVPFSNGWHGSNCLFEFEFYGPVNLEFRLRQLRTVLFRPNNIRWFCRWNSNELIRLCRCIGWCDSFSFAWSRNYGHVGTIQSKCRYFVNEHASIDKCSYIFYPF